MKKVIFIVLAFTFMNCSSVHEKKNTFTLTKKQDIAKLSTDIPQGTFEYEIYFSEHGGRMENSACIVQISGKNITVTQKEGETNLSGGNIIAKGILIQHTSRNWIIAESEEDSSAEEYGGCTGGPIPINFEKKLIEMC